MKLKVKDGKVIYRMRAGKDIVEATMDAEIAEKIIANNAHTIVGDEAVVNEKFMFPLVKEKPRKTKV